MIIEGNLKSDIIRNRRILVVDDHRNIRISLRMTLEGEGAKIVEAETVKNALDKLGISKDSLDSLNADGPAHPHENHQKNPHENSHKNPHEIPQEIPFDCVLLDIRLPDGSGLDILKLLSKVKLATRVIMISGEGTVSDAFRATQMGAFDYIEKPFGEERIIVCVARCLDFNRIATDIEKLEERLKSQEIIGDHAKIQEILRLINRVAPTNGRVLIMGESGTGKELVARAIHRASTRSDKPLIKVNCAAIPQNLIESELFGHEKGSFTGAIKTRKGVFERADGGTLFLDEIGELGADVQAKLLRVLQNGEIQRVGAEKTTNVDVRLLAATNRDLSEMVQTGEFREDLYYRLNVVTFQLPPLRDRASDISHLAQLFLKEACREHSLGEKVFGVSAIKQMEIYKWPGNIRELRNVIERSAILSEESIIDNLTDILPAGLAPPETEEHALSVANPEISLRVDGGEAADGMFAFTSRVITWQDFHEGAGRSYLKYILKMTQGNVSEAARLLCLERAYLHRLMKKLGIQRGIVVSD